MKRIHSCCGTLIVILFFILLFFSFSGIAFAQEKEVPLDARTVIYDIFGEKSIKSIEYLYGFDEESDYLYVDFEDYGYAVFFASTMEMLEYSPKGNLPFRASDERAFSL